VDRQHTYARLALILFALIVLRQGLAWPPVFGGESILEDFVLLLILAFAVVSSQLRPIIWHAITFLISSLMVAMAWPAGGRLSLLESLGCTVIFASLALHSAVLGVRELLGLRGRGPIHT
jgi:hypothetical protein